MTYNVVLDRWYIFYRCSQLQRLDKLFPGNKVLPSVNTSNAYEYIFLSA